jgi:hypothetical protein
MNPISSTTGRALARFLLVALATTVALGPGRAAEPADGLRATPDLGWKRGDHRVDLSLATRFRLEYWDDRARHGDVFYALRTRLGLRYRLRDRLELFAEVQDARIYGLGAEASGAGALYRRFADQPGGLDHTNSQKLRQLYVQIAPIEGLALRVGRFDVKLGTEVGYPEPDWKYLKVARASQRLVGTVGWTHGERGSDGVSVAYDAEGHHGFGFVARPTQGVFDVENAYGFQEDILYGGISWTVKRGAWLEDTEIRPFFVAYDDDRSVRHGGLAKSVNVYTLGVSAIGIHPLGPGNLDWLIWGAYQTGRYDGLDHDAGAGILEIGYRLAKAPSKPWLRLGVNVATGDDDPTDGDHETFFNLLPTNHLYYGFADRFAFQNLIDLIAQVRLAPHPRVGVNLMAHGFWATDPDDATYGGTGAWNRTLFGYAATPSPTDSRRVGAEIDLVVDVKVHEHLALQAGYARLWRNERRNPAPRDDTDFAYLQMLFHY